MSIQHELSLIKVVIFPKEKKYPVFELYIVQWQIFKHLWPYKQKKLSGYSKIFKNLPFVESSDVGIVDGFTPAHGLGITHLYRYSGHVKQCRPLSHLYHQLDLYGARLFPILNLVHRGLDFNLNVPTPLDWVGAHGVVGVWRSEHQLLHGASVQTLGLPGRGLQRGNHRQATGIPTCSWTEQSRRN